MAQLPAKGNSQSLPACWVPPVLRGTENFTKSNQPVDREVWSAVTMLRFFYKSSMLVDREVWSVLVKFFTSPTTWSTGKSGLVSENFTSPTCLSTGKSGLDL